MKHQPDPIIEEVNRILQEKYPHLHIEKLCFTYCGARCNCKGAVPIRDIDIALEEARSKFKVSRV